MDTNAVALRALASTVAGAALVAIGFILMNTVLSWGIVVLGAMLVQAGLVGFVISGWAGVRATLDAER